MLPELIGLVRSRRLRARLPAPARFFRSSVARVNVSTEMIAGCAGFRI